MSSLNGAIVDRDLLDSGFIIRTAPLPRPRAAGQAWFVRTLGATTAGGHMTSLSTLEKFSHHYVTRMLSRVNRDRLVDDSYYAKRLFFHYWAFERAGAPKAFRVAAVKTVA
ncbi:MAG: hypothetical protein M1470_12630 [Bacteroidetes bacterium]|nr:hypothetical protein [Bacteroidota bacterium]MCL5738010.1 hypothetical protein [Bacteroidota bacterium]